MFSLKHPEPFDLRLCSGPQAAWAWRAFAAHLPTFQRLTSSSTETGPRHVLHAANVASNERAQLTSEEIGKWRWGFLHLFTINIYIYIIYPHNQP